MKQTINFYDFNQAFNNIRPANFSYDGLLALFNYLEQYEDDCGTEIELDVIALCCDFTESTYHEIYNDYIYDESCGNKHIYNNDVYEQIQELDDQEEINACILEWLQENTTVIEVNDQRVIYQAF